MESMDFLKFIGTLVGIFGTLFGMYTYIRKKERRLLTWNAWTGNIVNGSSKKIPGLRVSFEDKTISSLSLTEVVLNNSGSRALKCEDIPEDDPLTIHFADSTQILYVEGWIPNRATQTDVKCRIDENSVVLSFPPHLKKKECIKVQILQVGKADVAISGEPIDWKMKKSDNKGAFSIYGISVFLAALSTAAFISNRVSLWAAVRFSLGMPYSDSRLFITLSLIALGGILISVDIIRNFMRR